MSKFESDSSQGSLNLIEQTNFLSPKKWKEMTAVPKFNFHIELNRVILHL